MGEGIDPRRIAFIGFGEAGGILARGLVASGRHDVAAYDLLLDDKERSEAMRAKARAFGIAATVEEVGLEPLMASATADRQQWVADPVAEAPGLKEAEDAEWRETIDAVARAAGMRPVR